MQVIEGGAMNGDEWTNPLHPPVEAIDLGGTVWVSWASVYNRSDEPLIWHWCSRDVIRRDPNAGGLAGWRDPQWVPAGARGHTLVARSPLHLEPSLLWSDCCGKHGFIRDGRWAGV